MKHIELLTIESYLETKKEVIENGGYTPKELHIEHEERITEIIEDIYEEYFGDKEGDEQEPFIHVGFKKKGMSYEVWAISNDYFHRDAFMINLKNKYTQWLKEKKESEIIKEIEKVLTTVFIVSSRWHDDVIKRVYEIIKYTLSKGKHCDYWCNGKYTKEMYNKEEDEVVLPFEIEDATLPIYCKNMQSVLFGTHRKIFISPRKNEGYSDITRFSFYNVTKIVEAVTKELKKANGENYKEDDKDYNCGYIEGREDYLVLDEILGITLTNIIYWKTREIKDREIQENIIKVVSYLAKCHYSTGKNFVAQVLMDYLEAVDYNAEIIRRVGEFLKKEIKRWDEYYEEIEAVGLYSLFSYLKGCSESDLVEVCKDIKGDNWSEYMYMEEIAKNEKMIRIDGEGKYKKEKKIRIPKGNMDNRTWYAYIHKTVFESIWN